MLELFHLSNSSSTRTKELEKFYNMFHLSEQDGGKYDWIEGRMNADFHAKIDLLKKFSKEGDSLLDVGCGKGYFIFESAKEGIKAKGIDVSISAIDFGKNKLNVDAISGKIEDYSSLP